MKKAIAMELISLESAEEAQQFADYLRLGNFFNYILQIKLNFCLTGLLKQIFIPKRFRFISRRFLDVWKHARHINLALVE